MIVRKGTRLTDTVVAFSYERRWIDSCPRVKEQFIHVNGQKANNA